MAVEQEALTQLEAELTAEVEDLRAQLAEKDRWLRIILASAGAGLSDADGVASPLPG